MTRFRPRVIPCLLLDGLGLTKTIQFSDRTYLGDPVNTVRIFNEKGADEVVLLDINATVRGAGPPFELLAEIASEAFMPLAYGGGITNIVQIRNVLALGYEKVVLNTVAHQHPEFVAEAARVFGSSTVVVSIDARRFRLGGHRVMTAAGSTKTSLNPVAVARQAADQGAGEILLQSVDRDGTQGGFDLELVRAVAEAVDIPVVASGGAGSVTDLGAAIAAGASAAAAGSLFVFNGKHRVVLISYPRDAELERVFADE